MKMNNAVKSVRVLHDQLIRVAFSDGYVGQVDLSGLFRLHPGRLVEELRSPEQFGKVVVENDTLTFSNGYDICPDVLRFYCERGGVLSQAETDAAFAALLREEAPQTAAVAEDKADYGQGEGASREGRGSRGAA